MEARKMARSLLASVVLAALAAHAFVGVVGARSSPAEKGDVKKPDCVPGMDPRSFPGIGGHGGITPVPSHGGITPVPSHGGSSSGSDPSHGGGYGGSPSHGGSSGGLPSPSHGGFGTSPTSPSTGGGYGGGSPATPSHGGGAYGSSPSTPSHGGGAYGSSPTPSHGAYGGSSPPALGGLPGTTAPMPFVPVDPHSPNALPGSCDYWRSHPMEIWSAIGNRFPSMNMGHFFGTAGSNMSIQDALANTRTDGAGALLREGAAALLNSMTRASFPYTTNQVRDAFAAAAAGGSDGAAAAQAAAFKKANEGTA